MNQNGASHWPYLYHERAIAPMLIDVLRSVLGIDKLRTAASPGDFKS
jgi:hypothetical protein